MTNREKTYQLSKKGLSRTQIAKELGISKQAVSKYFTKPQACNCDYEVKIKYKDYGVCLACFGTVRFYAVEELLGIDRKYVGGSFRNEGREFTRSRVRARDKHTCQSCGLVRTPEQVQKYNSNFKGLKGRMKNLDVHHTKGLCGKRSVAYDSIKDIHLLVTLCHKCHFNQSEHRCKSQEFKQKRVGTSQEVISRRIRELRSDGHTFKKIGYMYNISKQRVHQIYKKSLST